MIQQTSANEKQVNPLEKHFAWDSKSSRRIHVTKLYLLPYKIGTFHIEAPEYNGVSHTYKNFHSNAFLLGSRFLVFKSRVCISTISALSLADT